jgi:hypothetical protein
LPPGAPTAAYPGFLTSTEPAGNPGQVRNQGVKS